jgi:hypothetical protein
MAFLKLDHFVQFSDGYKKMAAKNGLVLRWLVPAEIDPSIIRFVWFSDVYCTYSSGKR